MKRRLEKKDLPRAIAVMLIISVFVILALTALIKCAATSLAAVV